MLFAVNRGIFVITAIMNVFVGFFTPILIIKITECSGSFILPNMLSSPDSDYVQSNK